MKATLVQYALLHSNAATRELHSSAALECCLCRGCSGGRFIRWLCCNARLYSVCYVLWCSCEVTCHNSSLTSSSKLLRHVPTMHARESSLYLVSPF